MRGRCSKHNAKRPCYTCGQEAKRKADALASVGHDGSLTARLRKLLVDAGMVSAKKRESIFRACAMMETRAPWRN